MTESWTTILALAAGTYAIRIAGVLLGRRLPRTGFWARALEALPGCLIVSLVAVLLAQGGPREWAAGAAAALVALLTKNLPLTMIAGVGAVWVLRTFV